jgi:hypothetical protein
VISISVADPRLYFPWFAQYLVQRVPLESNHHTLYLSLITHWADDRLMDIVIEQSINAIKVGICCISYFYIIVNHVLQLLFQSILQSRNNNSNKQQQQHLIGSASDANIGTVATSSSQQQQRTSSSTITSTNERAQLKHLANWLGLLTLAQNRPILDEVSVFVCVCFILLSLFRNLTFLRYCAIH